jgi:pimeloyl-ACP methyl ester carboxylesterase
MGGFASFYLAGLGIGVRTAVSIAGILDFSARWADVVLESTTYPAWAVQMAAVRAETEKHNAVMAAHNPAPRLQTYAPRPLLMIQGDQDLDSPKKYVVDMYRALQPHYTAAPDALRLAIHDYAGHQLTAGMVRDTVTWFEKQL